LTMVTAVKYASPAARLSIYHKRIFWMLVYVLNNERKPLMPCQSAVARLLLKDGRAKVVRRCPFTIQLLQLSQEYKQPLTLGIDTGSAILGSAVVDNYGRVVYMGEVEVRNDIAENMKQRAMYRRNRRNRKTWYRKPRFLNRKNSIKSGRLPPTLRSKLDSHEKEIRFVKSIMPITTMILETATFDPHALKNPAVLKNKWLYQHGTNFGFANTKAFVLDRDGYSCQFCLGKSKDSRLHVHHIIFRSSGGSDEESNLIVLCETCHKKLHEGLISLKKTGKRKGNLKHATQMNILRSQLVSRSDVIETFGFITKEIRQYWGLPKEHYFDAVAIASQGSPLIFKTDAVVLKRCVADGDYQISKGIRGEQRIETGKICGFRKFDKVRYQGKEYFIKGRMSTGYAILMEITFKKVDLKPIPKFSIMRRQSARKSWMMTTMTIANIR
jgi:RRXRR protein/HNH endonuclease